MPTVEVCLSPALLHLTHTAGKTVVIIDVFRATSTIAAALHNGAKEIIPVATVEEAIAIGKETPNSLTAGERDGKVATGLQYGNSPAEYPGAFIKGKTLVLTTTNGTRLLHMVQDAAQIVTGAFLNLSALSSYLLQQGNNVVLGCAAWKDKFNLEDTVFAGALAKRLLAGGYTTNDDATRSAVYLDQQAGGDYAAFLRDSSHYHRLAAYGLEHDLVYCSTPDLHPVVPVLDGTRLVAREQ
jgi:2-phosphosulfolactate phosphatase